MIFYFIFRKGGLILKEKTKSILKIFLILFACFIIIGTGIFVAYKYIEHQHIQQNIDYIYHIYNNDNRQDIINQYPTSNNDTTTIVGVPIESENNKEVPLNAIGTIEIPSIGFRDILLEGTTQDVLANGLGLFEHSSIFQGNVCIAGHNTSRFLAKLKDVKQGDIIKYASCLGNREYKISTIKQIEETDWSMLEDTTDNKLTIITCVKNQRNLRLCVQATEIK